MEYLTSAVEFLFGCCHSNLSRVFTTGSKSYCVCCDCGATFSYSLETMKMGRRLRERNPGSQRIPLQKVA